MELFLLYLWTRLDAINSLLTAVTAAGGAITFFCTVVYIVEDEEATKQLVKFRHLAWVPIIALGLNIITPSKQDAAIIAGGWGILEISKNKDVQQIGDNTLELIKQKLDKQLEQTSDSDQEESK